MKAIHWITAAAALTFAQTALASAAQSDPEVLIHRFPGVYDLGNNATTFHCTNFSGVPENIRFVTRNQNGSLLTNVVFSVTHLATLTASTHDTVLYGDAGALLNTDPVVQGTTAIAATSINVICTAVTLDALAIVPNGFALRGIRFNPAPGSQE